MQPVTEKAKKDKMLSIAAISAVHKFQYLLFAKCYLKTSFERKKSYFQTAAEHTTYSTRPAAATFFLRHFLRAFSSFHFLRAAIVVFS